MEAEIAQLKERLLQMASRAEAAAAGALKALIRRDDQLARRTDQEEDQIDRLQMEIDQIALSLLIQHPEVSIVRLLAVAMKIAHELERVGDEATTISRRCLELGREPRLEAMDSVSALGVQTLRMLKEALDSFVRRDTTLARAVITQDDHIDALTRNYIGELTRLIRSDPTAPQRPLNLMVVARCLERVADHATNIAEMVVYLYEGRDIRHRQGAAS